MLVLVSNNILFLVEWETRPQQQKRFIPISGRRLHLSHTRYDPTRLQFTQHDHLKWTRIGDKMWAKFSSMADMVSRLPPPVCVWGGGGLNPYEWAKKRRKEALVNGHTNKWTSVSFAARWYGVLTTPRDMPWSERKVTRGINVFQFVALHQPYNDPWTKRPLTILCPGDDRPLQGTSCAYRRL
jgi:hypothetical protein